MALITEFIPEWLDDTKVQEPVVKATYSIFKAGKGKRYLYIRTFGSKDRVKKGSPSQFFQLDEKAIAQLKQILAEV